MNRILAALTIALSLATSAALAEDKPTFVFTAIPDSDETRLIERFTRVAEYLAGQARRSGQVSAGEELPGFSHRLHQQPGANGLVRRLYRRAGSPPSPRFGGYCARRRGCRLQELFHRQRQDRPEALGGFPQRDRRQVLHLRFARLHLRPADARIFPASAIRREIAGRTLLACRIFGRP